MVARKNKVELFIQSIQQILYQLAQPLPVVVNTTKHLNLATSRPFFFYNYILQQPPSYNRASVRHRGARERNRTSDAIDRTLLPATVICSFYYKEATPWRFLFCCVARVAITYGKCGDLLMCRQGERERSRCTKEAQLFYGSVEAENTIS